jgi:hypothetical protein
MTEAGKGLTGRDLFGRDDRLQQHLDGENLEQAARHGSPSGRGSAV